MLERLKLRNKNDYNELLEFIDNQRNPDFYFLQDNARYYITDIGSLKTFIKSCSCAFVSKYKEDYKGLIFVCKSKVNEQTQYEVKIVANSNRIAKDLITILLWNFNRDLIVWFRNNNKLLYAFKEKGFRFVREQGVQILLNRKAVPYEQKFYKDKSE